MTKIIENLIRLIIWIVFPIHLIYHDMLFSWFYYSTQKRKKYISKHQSTEDFKASCSENILKFVGKHQLLSLHLWLVSFTEEIVNKKPYFSWSVIVLVGGWLVKGVGLKFFVGRDYRLLSKFRYHVLKFGIKVSETFNLCFVTDNASICTIKVKNWGFFP